MATTDNFLCKYFKITNRTLNLIHTAEADMPITLIGGSLTILTDDSEVIDFIVRSNSIDYTILKGFRIKNDSPDLFFKLISRLVLNPGDQIYIQAVNSFGVLTLPEIHGTLSYVRQPKLN